MIAQHRAESRKRAVVSERFLMPRRLLLDTHVWLWWQFGSARLGSKTRALIQSAPEVRVSCVSVWEIAIKTAQGKLEVPPDANVVEDLASNGFEALVIDVHHADEVRRLPLIHRDPFDRMLVAQSRLEGLTVVTTDRRIPAYGVPVWDAVN